MAAAKAPMAAGVLQEAAEIPTIDPFERAIKVVATMGPTQHRYFSGHTIMVDRSAQSHIGDRASGRSLSALAGWF